VRPNFYRGIDNGAISTTTGIDLFVDCLKHSAKSRKHSAKALSSDREIGELYIDNDFFAEYFLSDTRQRFCRAECHSVLGKEKSSSPRPVMETMPLPIVLDDTRQRDSLRRVY
jgi:hypothetical protein